MELDTHCVVLHAIADDNELSVLDGLNGRGAEGGVVNCSSRVGKFRHCRISFSYGFRGSLILGQITSLFVIIMTCYLA